MIRLGLKIERQKALILIQEIVAEYGSNSSKHYNYFIRRLIQHENYTINFNEQVRFITAAVMAYHGQKIKHIQLYDDVLKSLEKLKKSSIKTAIITDGIPIKQYEKILRLGIDDLIDLVVISDEIGIRKPNPELFSYCLKKFKVKGHETIKINKIHSVYIHRGGKYDTNVTGETISEENKPDHEISRLDELFNIINDINKKFYIGKV